MKHRILHIALILLAAIGLLLITGSFFMALGILIMLLLIEYVIIDKIDSKRRNKRE